MNRPYGPSLCQKPLKREKQYQLRWQTRQIADWVQGWNPGWGRSPHPICNPYSLNCSENERTIMTNDQ
jgi:hypothetical protein